MLSTSLEYRRLVAANSHTLFKATLTFADSTVRELTGDDVMSGGASYTEATSSASSFDVGAAVVGQMKLTLNNRDGRFDECDFTYARIAAYEGVELRNGGVEWLLKGTYNVEQPSTYGSTIGLTCLDDMSLLDRPYADVTTEYPATLRTIVRDACAHCGVSMRSSTFDNDTLAVAKRPDDSTLSCRDVVSYAAQASGNYAKCDPYGRLVLRWYDTAAFEGEDWLDGGTYDTSTTPYSDGDAADGGGFMDGGGRCDGGSFGLRPYAIVHALASLSVGTDDVVVTGVRVTASDEVTEGGYMGDEGESRLYGDDGYVLSIEGNPLVEYGHAEAVAQAVGARVVGMRFRAFDVSCVGDPAWEAGDPVVVIDADQRQYRSFITSLTYKPGSYEAISCGAETPARNSAAAYSALTKAVVRARRDVRLEKTARELAVESLALQLAESSGLFMTAQEQQDHSVIYYMHDKPTLAESQVVWKLTANALGISTDGGATYPYGLDVTGNAILNRIYAIGLDASYITSGNLRVTDGSIDVLSADADTGVVILRDAGGNYWNMHTGELRMAATSSIAGTNYTFDDLVDGVEATVTGVAVEFNKNQSNQNPPAESDPNWSTTAPQWESGKYIWQRIATTTASGTEYSDVVCISGRDGATGTNAAAVYLYARGASAPARNMADPLTYTFSSGALSGSLGSWSRSIPSGTDTCWVTMATAIGNSATDNIARAEWSEPVALSTAGVNGLNQATVMLFQRKAAWRVDVDTLVAPSGTVTVSGTTATVPGTVSGTTLTLASDKPAKPNVQTTYTFASGDLSPVPSGWSRSVPSGSDPCYVTTAAAINSAATDVIAASEWADVQKLSQDGISPKMHSVRYAVGESGAAAPASGWQAAVPATQQGKWLWVRTTYTDGRTADTCSYMGTDGKDGTSVVVQSSTKAEGVTTVKLVDSDGNVTEMRIADGADGPTGTPGANGKNVHIAWATSADGSSGFSTTVSEGKTYIGVYDSAEAADSTNPGDYSWSKIKGEDGVGISSTTVTYGKSSSASTRPTNWQSSIPTVADGQYLWTRTVTDYTDPSVPDTVTFTYAKQGVQGQQGPRGTAGSSVTVSSIKYQIGASSVTAPTGTWQDAPYDTTAAKPYLWTKTTFSDSTVAYGVAKRGVGIASYEPQWYLSTSNQNATGGTGWQTSQPAWQAGRYIWERTKVTWEDGDVSYAPSENGILAGAINSANQKAKAASDLAEDLDEVLNGDNRQLEIFNRLTGDGSMQGVYIENGRVYINASYIKSGSLQVSAGGYTLFKASVGTGSVQIAGFTAAGNHLYSGKDALTSNSSGVYVGTDGISVGSGTAYTALSGGYLRGGTSNDITGYVGFNNYWTASGVYGTRLAGRGCIALLTNGAFGIGSYYGFGETATITVGQSGTLLEVVTGLTATWTNMSLTGSYNVPNLCQDLDIRWTKRNITFTKGLMTTAI